MTGNPTTDRYAANIQAELADHDRTCINPTCDLEQVIDMVGQQIIKGLPGIDPALIGEIGLHWFAYTGSLFISELNSGLGPFEAHNTSINKLALVAGRLYTPNPVDDLPPLDGTT